MAKKIEKINVFDAFMSMMPGNINAGFTISEKVLEEIKQIIQTSGYNKKEPVVIWKSPKEVCNG